MAEGKLLTSGTPLFLKSRFGVGYHLTVVKGEDCISEAISDIILSQVDGSKKVHSTPCLSQQLYNLKGGVNLDFLSEVQYVLDAFFVHSLGE